jgi:hypothetical protein
MSDVSIHDVEFVNEQVGYVTYWTTTGEYYIKKTTDGGQYWTHCKALKDTIIIKMKFFNENFDMLPVTKVIFLRLLKADTLCKKNY